MLMMRNDLLFTGDDEVIASRAAYKKMGLKPNLRVKSTTLPVICRHIWSTFLLISAKAHIRRLKKTFSCSQHFL